MSVANYVDSYFENYKNYKTYWNYEDGCVLMGAKLLYDATGNEKYFDFVLRYLNPLVDEDGTINNYEIGKFNIDGFNCGKVLFAAYDKTGDERFKRAVEFLMDNLKKQPRTNEGNFWHKAIYPNQVWLDGLYMAQPFYMEYETRFNGKCNYADIVSQFKNVRRIMFDEDKRLYYHGYDEARVQNWADKATGLSKNFWLRSVGWHLMALIDTIGAVSDQIYEHYRDLCDIFKEAVHGILRYQDYETKLFFQVVDHPEASGNYTETSGSAMVAYSIMKGCRLGVLNFEKYAHLGMEIFDNIVTRKLIDGKLTDICKVAGLGPDTTPHRDGTVAYYLSEPKICDDAKGVGAFVMAYAQRLILFN